MPVSRIREGWSTAADLLPKFEAGREGSRLGSRDILMRPETDEEQGFEKSRDEKLEYEVSKTTDVAM